MQLHVRFFCQQVNLPIAYRHTQQGLLYHGVSSDLAFSTQLHEEGRIVQNRSFKLFTFSPLNGIYTIQDKRIIFRDELSMEVRSVDDYFIRQLAAYLSVGSTVTLGQNAVEVSYLQLTDERLLASEVHIQTMSPIVVYRTQETGRTQFFSPAEAEFCPALIRNAQRKWQSLHGEDAPFALEVATVASTPFRKVPTSFKGTFITGWNCELMLRGMPEVLDMLYQTGLGAKNSQGFGMFRVL